MATDDIQYPSGFGLNDVVGWGTTGLVVLDKSSNTIIKTPLDQENIPFMSRKQQIYPAVNRKRGPQGTPVLLRNL
jgi:hypothetical protein